MIDSRCGLHCNRCGWKDSHGCGGCIETKGNPFHGECPVAVCCQNSAIEHCGDCPDIPCKLLTDDSCHPEHGDKSHGARIEQCREWALTTVMTKFAESGWDVIDAAAKAWLAVKDETTASGLIKAVKTADEQCGSCGCEFDPLYKKALILLKA